MKIVIVLSLLLFAGCATTQTVPVEVPDPKCEAIRNTQDVKIRIPEGLDLSAYADIEFIVVEDKDGKRWVTIPMDDYKKIGELMTVLGNYIHQQRQTILRMDQQYREALFD